MADKCYPSWRYHATEAPRLVNHAEHELEVAHPDEGWKETPADLPAPPPPDPNYCKSCGQRLPGTDASEPESESAAPAVKRDRKAAKPKGE